MTICERSTTKKLHDHNKMIPGGHSLRPSGDFVLMAGISEAEGVSCAVSLSFYSYAQQLSGSAFFSGVIAGGEAHGDGASTPFLRCPEQVVELKYR